MRQCSSTSSGREGSGERATTDISITPLVMDNSSRMRGWQAACAHCDSRQSGQCEFAELHAPAQRTDPRAAAMCPSGVH